MDIDPLDIVRKVWSHAGVTGNVWMPHIYAIGVKGKERFREGTILDAKNPVFPELRESVDWYWTPGISNGTDRKIKARTTKGAFVQYPRQRVVWVDCDESYNDKLLESLKPSYMWETSPGHKQAVWLLKDSLVPSEYNKDGFIGMLTQALGADKSGVDIGQLLRVPGTNHHKRGTFQGKVLRSAGTVHTKGALLSRVARGLGFAPGLASELGADDPYGDRSKVLWRFARNAAELGLDQDLTFKLIKATKWNKWKDEPERLKEDIARAYEAGSATPKKDPEQEQARDEEEEAVEAEPWGMARVEDFGPVIRKPVKWIVPGIIAEASVGLIVAAPKVGKTRIAIEIALGLATGSKPLGLGVQGQTPVGFFSLEDGEHLFSTRLDVGMRETRRKFHWEGSVTYKDGHIVWQPQVPMNLFTHFSQMDLTDEMDMARLEATIEANGLKLVIIDTLSMAIGNANVSDQTAMNPILKEVRRIARATGCSVMFIHHTRKRVFEKGETIQETILGATALHAWCDFIMNLVSPTEDSDLMRLGVQTKRGNDTHYISTHLKIIKKAPVEETVA